MTTRSSAWTEDSIPDQTGRVAVISGANSGLGLATALILARKNARIVLACRNPERAAIARDTLVRESDNQAIDCVSLALDRLDQVGEAAKALLQRYQRIDLLINNAGVMVPRLELSPEGVDLHMAVNHLGHFAWTGLLLPRLLATPGSRIVSLGSLAHLTARSLPEDLRWPSGAAYSSFGTYARSKLAVLLFTRALQQRLQEAGADTLAMAAHPGGSRTELLRAPVAGMRQPLARRLLQYQSPALGALPILRAAIDPDAKGGEYYGPGGFLELKGYPKRAYTRRAVDDPALQARLWRASEVISGVAYPV